MKQFKLIIIGIALFSLFLLPKAANAQIDTRIGAMLAYGTEIENPGIGVNAEFGVLDKLSISPSFIYFFPKGEGDFKVKWYEISANVNYYFMQDNIDFYGLAGLNYTIVSVPSISFGGMFGETIKTESVSDGRFGLNLGAGANFHIGSSILPFAELKYVIIDGGQLVIAAGIKFNI